MAGAPQHTPVPCSWGAHTCWLMVSGPAPPPPHLRLRHASSTTLKKPTQHLHHRGKLRHGHRHPAILQGKAGKDGVSCNGLERNNWRNNHATMLWSRGGFCDVPILSAPVRAEDHGVLTWACHCSDNLMHSPQPSSPRWGQVQRGLPGEVHAVQLQQDLHCHGHAVRQGRWSVDTLPTHSRQGSFHVGAISQYIPECSGHQPCLAEGDTQAGHQSSRAGLDLDTLTGQAPLHPPGPWLPHLTLTTLGLGASVGSQGYRLQAHGHSVRAGHHTHATHLPSQI